MADAVTVLHSAQGAANAIMALGVATGTFAAEGLDVTMREVARTGQAVTGVIEGAAQFAVAGAMPVLMAAAAGHDPVIVMSLEAQNVFGVIGARDVFDPLHLRGRGIAITAAGEQDDLIMRRTLIDWGFDPDHDVRLETLGSRGKCFEAVLSGAASAMTATIPQPILARALGLPVLKDYVPLHEPFQLGAIVTTRRLADARPQLVARLLRGQRSAMARFRDDFDAALPHLKARSKLDDIDVLRETHRLFAAEADHFVPTARALQAVVDATARYLGQRVAADVGAIVEPSFARALAAVG